MRFKKLLTTVALAFALSVPLTSGLIGDTTAPAQAACGLLCDGTGNDGGGGSKPPSGNGSNNNDSGGTGGNNSGSGGGSGNGGGSSDGSNWEIYYSKIWVKDCPTRSDGAKPVRMKIAYKEIYKNTVDYKKPDDKQWKYEGFFPSTGHAWSRFAHQYNQCLYGSAYVTKTMTCNISATVSLNMREPLKRVLMTKTGRTGYREGSANYDRCKDSVGNVQAGITPNKYGFYDTYTSKRAQTLTYEVAVTKNMFTGTYDKLKVKGVSPAYNTTPRLGMTLSLDCKNAYLIPGQFFRNYWVETACRGNSQTSYVCSTPDIKVDVSDTGKARRIKSVKNGQTLELLNDGKPRLIEFSQKISGKNIKINSYQHRYLRSGSPWDSSMSLNKNLVELSKTAKGGSIWKKSGETNWMAGNGGSIYLTSIQASNPNSSTKLTHEIKWTGTKTIKSVKIDSINADTGKINLKPVTIQVPTEGTCSQTVNLKYIRTIGDAS